MKKRHVIVFIVILALLAIYFFNKKVDGITVETIEDGNTIVMSNGLRVRMIGVSSSTQGHDYLNENIIGEEVILISDASAPFDPNNVASGDLVFAYVLSEDKLVDYNAHLLKHGMSLLQESSYLQDSLASFRKYAKIGAEYINRGDITPTPTPVPIIDYKKDSIYLPDPPTPSRIAERKHHTWYSDGNMNIEMIDEACDYDRPNTKQFANDLAGRSQGPFNAGQICEIFKYCYDKWRYVNDPNGHEYIAAASESIGCNLSGDCDDFAVLMASCMLAIGGNASVNSGHGSEGGHAFAEVDISGIGEDNMLRVIQEKFPNNTISNLCVRRDNGHIWLNLDWWAAYPGGKYFSCSRLDAYSCVNGNWTWTRVR